MKNLYIIGGCNGAGKTTASYTILPEILECKEFVNADEIAKGLSPFQPEKASLQAGKLMLTRIQSLLSARESFAFETTLATRSYINLIKKAKENCYEITLIFFWLNSVDLAIQRVKTRVADGGHNISKEVIKRRYRNGLLNFYKLYKNSVHSWVFIDNSGDPYQVIAEGIGENEKVLDQKIWSRIKHEFHE